MAELFQTTKQNISLHVNNVFKEAELEQDSTVKEYLTVQNEGKRTVSRNVKYYNLDVIISVGYRVKSKRGAAFRIWANRILKDYLVKGYAVNQRIHSEQIAELRQQVQMVGRTIQSQQIVPSTAALPLPPRPWVAATETTECCFQADFAEFRGCKASLLSRCNRR